MSSALPPAPEAAIADAVVIGAGPVGLFQVFQLGLQGLHCHVVDALPEVGGQCAQLYPDKPIYDIPGLLHTDGRTLAAQLHQQIAPFAPHWHLGQQVQTLAPLDDASGFALTLSPTGASAAANAETTPPSLRARSVFIAAGVGAFVPRTIKADSLDAHLGQQLHYHPSQAQRQALLAPLPAQATVVVHGGDEAAVQAAIACAQQRAAQHPGPDCAPVVLLHRRDVFQAPPAQLAELQALRKRGLIQVQVGQISGCTSTPALHTLTLLDAEGHTQHLPLALLLVYLGLSPRLGPLADWGLALERKQLVVDTAHFETSIPGIYAVGDINTYPGKRKLMVSGFHEATLAAFAAAERLSGAPVPLQYTTTSSLLHQRLGVAHNP